MAMQERRLKAYGRHIVNREFNTHTYIYKSDCCYQLTNAPDTVLSIGNSLHESYDLQNLKKCLINQ